ncbi:MAG TPA: cytochrome c oxidase assembly protein [Gaiellales bacterium]|jgi:cytochrome c oxidase assembly factor CtaG
MSAPSPWSFTFEPFFLVVAALALYLYVRHARTAGTGRRVLFGLGIACIAIPVNSPLETIATHYLLMAHLAQNAISADIAPPLLILGLPPEARAALQRRGGRAFAAITQPAIAGIVWLVTWYGVHLSVVYDFLLRHQILLNLEHSVLISAGLLFWWPVLSGLAGSLEAPGGLLYLFLAFATSAFLGLALTFLPSFYSYYQHTPRLWGLSPDADQNIGGTLMAGEQSAVFVAGMCWVFFRLLEGEEGDDDEAIGPIPDEQTQV